MEMTPQMILTLLLFGGQVILGLMIVKLQAGHARVLRLEASVEAAGGRLEQTAARLVEERFRAMTHEIASSVQAFDLVVTELRRRVDCGEGITAGLADSDNAIKLEVERRMGEFRAWAIERMISRQDFAELVREVRHVVSRMDRHDGAAAGKGAARA